MRAQVRQEVQERLDQVRWEERQAQRWQEQERSWWLEQRRAVWVGSGSSISRKGRPSEADPEKQDKLHFLFWRLCANLLGSGSLHCTGCNFSSNGIAFVRVAPHLAR